MKELSVRLTFTTVVSRFKILAAAFRCIFTGKMTVVMDLPEGYSIVRNTQGKASPIPKEEQRFWNAVDDVGKATDGVWKAMDKVSAEANRQHIKSAMRFDEESGLSRLRTFVRRFG